MGGDWSDGDWLVEKSRPPEVGAVEKGDPETVRCLALACEAGWGEREGLLVCGFLTVAYTGMLEEVVGVGPSSLALSMGGRE